LAEALPQTPLGGAELTAFPDPLAGFMGLREGEKNGKGAQERGIGIRESEKRGGEGRGKEGEEGEGREREDFRAPPPPVPNLPLHHCLHQQQTQIRPNHEHVAYSTTQQEAPLPQTAQRVRRTQLV